MRIAVLRSTVLSAALIGTLAAPASAGPPIELASLPIHIRYGVLPAPGVSPAGDESGEWRLLGGRLGADQRLTLDIEVRPAALDLALEPGPAVLVGRLGLFGDAGGDTGAGDSVPGLAFGVVRACPDPADCVYSGSITLPTDRLPALARQTPAQAWISATIVLELVRTFAQGSWVQVLPFYEASHVGAEGTVSRPKRQAGPLIAAEPLPVDQATTLVRHGDRLFTRIERMRRTVEDPSAPALPPAPAPTPTSAIANTGRPLSLTELLGVRERSIGVADPMVVVADAAVRRDVALRLPVCGPETARTVGCVIGVLDTPSSGAGLLLVRARPSVSASLPADTTPITGILAFEIDAGALRLLGRVEQPAGSYTVPVAADAMLAADALPVDALIAVDGWLGVLGWGLPCPMYAGKLGRQGTDSPFVRCPAGWITADGSTPQLPAGATAALQPTGFGIPVQASAYEAFAPDPGPATDFATPPRHAVYLLRHVANPEPQAGPAMGWLVIARLDPVVVALPSPGTSPLPGVIGIPVADWTATCDQVSEVDCAGVAGLFINNLARSGQSVFEESGGRLTVTVRPTCPAVPDWIDATTCWQATTTTPKRTICMVVARRGPTVGGGFGQVGGDDMAGRAGGPPKGWPTCH